MPNIKSAKKRVKQTEKRTAKNLARKSAVKTAIKKVLTALKANEDVAVAKKLLREAEASIARAKGKGVIHYKTAQRSISRLAKRVAAQEKTARVSK